MSAALVIALLATLAAALVLVHRDGIAVGREQALTETERRLKNLSRHHNLH